MTSRYAPGRLVRRAAGYATGIAIILLITAFYRSVVAVNPTTVGFTYLLAILTASVIWGFRVSVAMSLAAALAFDYFFLPPVGTFNIADPQDWVALFSFLVTSIIGGSLSAHARRRALEAHRRRQEVERLYEFSQRLLREGSTAELLSAIPQHIVGSFGAAGAALLISSKQEVHRAGIEVPQLGEECLRVAATGEALQAEGQRGVWFAPLRSGVNVIGSVGLAGSEFSAETVNALASLIAVAIERADAIEHVARMEAARESEHLKSVVLDAITHDFRTPLTCIKASVTGLLADLEFEREERRDLLEVIDEECDRIDQLVGKASEMAQLESGEVKLHRAPHAVGELISAAMADCKGVSRARSMHLGVPHKDLQVLVDLPLAKSVLLHLISNADLYSPPGLPITISTAEKSGFVHFSVADQGPGIEEQEAARIFEKFYRGKDHRLRVEGTGMGLTIARAIVQAHGGTIGVVSQPGQGSVFTFSLPIDRQSQSSLAPSSSVLAVNDEP
jgi:two-component system, OmpR family, sensor histidine kinase KdpD